MAVTKEIGGKTYVVDFSVKAQALVEAETGARFGSSLSRFLGGFTGETFAVCRNCIKLVDNGNPRQMSEGEIAKFAYDKENAKDLTEAILEEQDNWLKFIGVKVESGMPSSDGVSQDITPKVLTASKSGKSKRP